MGWLETSQPDGASAGHPIEIASANLACAGKPRSSAQSIRLEPSVTDRCGCGVTPARRVALPPAAVFAGLPPADGRPEARMVPFFVQIKCQLGKSYEVANRLADAEIASEIYSTAGEFDLLVKFYVEDKDRYRPLRQREGADHSRHPGHPHDHHLQGVLSGASRLPGELLRSPVRRALGARACAAARAGARARSRTVRRPR